MEKGHNKTTDKIIEKIDEDKIKEYISKVLDDEIINIPKSKIKLYFKKGFNKIKLTKTEYLILKNYTGFNFRGINSVLRDNWINEVNGSLYKEKEERFRANAKNISDLIEEFPKSRDNFKVYRGVTIEAFKSYGIDNINDLVLMEDKYVYEKGFTSTSLIRETSYFNKNVDGKIYNIELEIIIPKESKEGMPLTSYELSFSPGQNEYVLNRNSLFKILDVRIIKDKAYLKEILIPRRLYNKEKTK